MTVVLTTIFATFVAMIANMAERGYYHHQSNELEREGRRHRGNDDPFDSATILSSSGYVYATDFADESTTLADLAQMMLPAWYELTTAQLPIFNPKVMPSEVYDSRKIILKTRDLLDALGPVYQPTSSFRLKKKHPRRQLRKEEDILRTLRFHLNRGYVRIGEFQDLHNAHVLYNGASSSSFNSLSLSFICLALTFFYIFLSLVYCTCSSSAHAVSGSRAGLARCVRILYQISRH